MRILFVTPPPYLPNRLHRMRSFDLIRILAKKHEVHLLSVTSQEQEPEEFKEIKKLCKSISIVKINPLKAFINILRFPFLPYEVAYCYSEKAKQEIQKIIKSTKIDLVYLKRLRSAIYLPQTESIHKMLSLSLLRHSGKRNASRISDGDGRFWTNQNDNKKVIIDSTDTMSMFYFRMHKSHPFPKNLFYLLQSVLYKRFERKIMSRIKNWIVCSQIDKKYLQELGGDINIHVVPNTVDTIYFSPSRSPSATSKVARQTFHLRGGVAPAAHLGGEDRGEYVNSLLFRGLMDKPVNIDACLFFLKEILPKVKQNIKDIKLFIVGPSPHRLIRKVHNGKDIFVTGFVKDIKEYMLSTAISICPVRIASGTRFKILQSWAMGRPVVSTAIGAEGLSYKNDYNIAIANRSQQFAEKVIRLLQDKKYYSRLQRNGLKSVQAKHSFEVVAQQLERAIKDVALHKRHSGNQASPEHPESPTAIRDAGQASMTHKA